MAGLLRARLPELDLEGVVDPRAREGRWSLAQILRATLVGLMAGCRSLFEAERLTEALSPAARRGMSRSAGWALMVAALLGPASAGAGRPSRGRGEVVLDGERVPVRWIDGDTFRIAGGRFAGRSARLLGVNALETYGPVHRWPGISPRALLAVARSTGPLAARSVWRCESGPAGDAYGRLLVSCPEAAEALVEAGRAMVFAVEGPADERLLAAQRRAQAARRGMWAGGVPPLVPSSVHSRDEAGLGPRGAYDRIVDTRTGAAVVHPHGRRYRACEEICAGDPGARACLVYVPFERRYRDRPSCLR